MKFINVWNDILDIAKIERFPKGRIILLEKRLLEYDSDILDEDMEIVFVIDEEDYQAKLRRNILESTNWKPAGEKDYWYRTDPPRPENQWNREICIAHKKNISSVPQWTWKANLQRKDQQKFTREPNNIVRSIAADFFGVDVNLIEIVIAKFDKAN